MGSRIGVALLGAPGSFSHEAALAFVDCYALNNTFEHCQTFADIFAKVTTGDARFGVVPLENSSIGSIVANYDLLWEHKAAIVAEYFLPVHHQLIGFPGTKIEDIKLVFSHPAALEQCRRLFQQHLNLSPRIHWDTSGAVAYVKNQDDHSSAAIASDLAAKEVDMTILLQDIEDYPLNATRFGLITRVADNQLPLPLIAPLDDLGESMVAAKQMPFDAAGGPYKMSFAVQLAHEVGSLTKLLSLLSGAGANLTKIESRPIGDAPWHYRFFIDVEVDSCQMEQNLERALEDESIIFKPLGRYLPAKRFE